MTDRSPSPLRLARGVALFAAALRTLVYAVWPVELSRDAAGYWRLAGTLLEHGGLLDAEGQPTAARLPGYPMFVAAIRAVVDAPEAVVFVHALLDGLNCYLIAILALRLSWPETDGPAWRGFGRRELGAAVSAFAWAIYPYSFAYGHRVITETSSVTLILAAALLVSGPGRDRWPSWLGLGVVWAALTHVKPTFMFFIPCWLAYRFVTAGPGRARVVRPIGVAFVAFVLALAPWPVRNRVQMGHWVVGATNFGPSFFNGVYGKGTLGHPWDYGAVEFGPGGADAEEIAKREALLDGLKHAPELVRNRGVGAVAWRLVKEDPLHFARNAALTVPRVWLRFPWEMPPTPKGLLLSALQLLWLGAGLWGGWRLLRSRGSVPEAGTELLRFVEAVCIYTTGVHLITTPLTRYSFQAYALLCAFIGPGAGSRKKTGA